jgi:hypothetical protein
MSDRQIAASEVADGKIKTPGGKYALLVVPGTNTLPLATGRAINRLVKDGATIVSYGQAPAGTPGWKYRDEQAEFDVMAREFMPQMEEENGYLRSPLGTGQIVIARDLAKTLAALNVRREAWSAPNRLQYLRRAWGSGDVYFIKNASAEPIDERIKLATDFAAALFMDPLTGAIGPADANTEQGGLRLQLDPGQTIFVKTYRNAFNYSGPAWRYRTPAGSASEIEGEWSVEFIAGGPELPPPFKTRLLTSWTDLAGAAGERFAGTARYTIRFAPDVDASRYLLDLGHVADSARVSLNGKPLATLFAPPFRVEISPRMSDNNTLTIEVTNVAANRIRDLDRRGVKWRIFKDINLVGIDYKPFDAAQWPVRPAGLLGPVTLTPLAD